MTLGGLLDVSLLDAEDVPLEIGDVDLGGLVTGAAERLSGLFVDRELRLQAPEGFTVEADPALLERAVESLLAAAATSTPPRRAVEVAVTRTEGRTTLKIAGDGVIPPELVAKIREPFGDDAGVAGPVARLALASKIVELHGSELEVQASPGRGHASGSAPWRSCARPRRGRVGPWLAESGQISPDDALERDRAKAAWRSHLRQDDEEDRERTPGRLGAAAAALATAASAMIVTGVVPDNRSPAAHRDHERARRRRRHPDAANDEKPKKKQQREDRAGDDAGGSGQGGSGGPRRRTRAERRAAPPPRDPAAAPAGTAAPAAEARGRNVTGSVSFSSSTRARRPREVGRGPPGTRRIRSTLLPRRPPPPRTVLARFGAAPRGSGPSMTR